MFGTQSILAILISNQHKEQKSNANAIYLICSYIGASSIGSFSGYILTNLGWTIFVLSLLLLIACSWGFIIFQKSNN